MPPRRHGRGIDFEHRYKASKWAEDRLFEAFRDTQYECLRLGISGFSADNTISTEAGQPKVPDLLLIDKSRLNQSQLTRIAELGSDLREVTSDRLKQGGDLCFILELATCAIEVEFSPYRAKEMAKRNWVQKSEEAFDRRPLRTAKHPIAPNIFVKEEDLDPLHEWSRKANVPIIVMHVFDQEAFAFDMASLLKWRERLNANPSQLARLCHTTGIFWEKMNYNRTDAQGASETKTVFMITPAAAEFAGEVKDVTVVGQLAVSSSQKYVASVKFEGGRVELTPSFIDWINTLD